jgi:hypothetical protein
LSGGTALAAFHIAHRLSKEDLDLFAAEPAPLEALRSFVRASGYAEPSYQHIFDRRLFLLPGTCPGKLKVEFTGYPPGALHEFFSGAARAWVRQSLTEDANGG